MKTVFKIAGIIFIVFLLIGGGFVFYLSRGLEEVSNMSIEDVNISALEDGVYNGKYDGGRWTNEVEVTINDSKITNINLVKDVVFSKPEVKQEMLNKVIEEQSIDVDAISGSTVTCKAYLKSIENALAQ